jgi:toxin-antitoxin system PIN domain toxin
MTSYLIDINVWLAMTWDLHPQHAPAARWSRSRSTATFLFCRFTMLGLIRLLTNSKVMGGSTTSVGEALNIYDQWIADPRVGFASEPSGLDLPLRQALEPFLRMPSTKAVADCYLVALAGATGAHLATFDRGIASTARLQRVPVTLLNPS